MAKGKIRARVMYNDGPPSPQGRMRYLQQIEEGKQELPQEQLANRPRVSFVIRCKVDAVECPHHRKDGEKNLCMAEVRCIYKVKELLDGGEE